MLSLFAPAKINLFLHITGKRDDGYHLLDSLTVFAADISDEIRIDHADHFDLMIDGAFAKGLSTQDNLITKAVRHYSALTATPNHYKIHLTKNIPTGAGLGGGSADAAATILGLERLNDRFLPIEQRNELLLSLGADVPVCYESVPLRFQGVGEKISSVPDLPEFSLVLIWPNEGVSTKDVFQNRQGELVHRVIEMPKAFDGFSSFIDFLKSTGNDLTVSAETLLPSIREARSFLQSQENCVLARMSGSGSCVFGIFETPEKARKTAEKAALAFPDHWIRFTKI